MGGARRSTDAVVRGLNGTCRTSAPGTSRPSRCRPGRYAVRAVWKLAHRSLTRRSVSRWASSSSLARRASSSDRCVRREHDRWGRRTPSSSGSCRDPRAEHVVLRCLPARRRPRSSADGGLGADRVALDHATGKPAARHRAASGPAVPHPRQLSPDSHPAGAKPVKRQRPRFTRLPDLRCRLPPASRA